MIYKTTEDMFSIKISPTMAAILKAEGEITVLIDDEEYKITKSTPLNDEEDREECTCKRDYEKLGCFVTLDFDCPIHGLDAETKKGECGCPCHWNNQKHKEGHGCCDEAVREGDVNKPTPEVYKSEEDVKKPIKVPSILKRMNEAGMLEGPEKQMFVWITQVTDRLNETH